MRVVAGKRLVTTFNAIIKGLDKINRDYEKERVKLIKEIVKGNTL